MTEAAIPAKPLPLADEITAPYWDAAREHRLAIQHCPACDTYVHAPVARCPRCHGEGPTWREMSGRATLYSYTVMHDAPAPAFADTLPYVVAIGELEEQPGLLLTANLTGVPHDRVHIGMPLEITFEELAPDAVVPQFQPRRA